MNDNKKQFVLVLQFNDRATGRPVSVELTEDEFYRIFYQCEEMIAKWNNEQDLRPN